MPRSDQGAPEVMTWPKASSFLIAALIFDLLRLFCNMFWLFGPGIAAALCSAYAADTLVGQVVGSTITTGACATGAAVAGTYGIALTSAFGTIMAMVVGLAGFLGIALCLVMLNPRIFKAQASGFLWMGGGLMVSLIPFVGALPALTTTVWRLYHKQIEVEKAAFKKYQASTAAKKAAEVRQRAAAQAAQAAQIEQAQTEMLAQEEGLREVEREQAAANDEYFVDEEDSEQRLAA